MQDRKDSHLALCLGEEIELVDELSNGFAAYRFEHDALPELDHDAVTVETELLGRTLSAPLVIGAMTGGTARAKEINRRLAIAAERCGVALALGSQRKMLEEGLDPVVRESYQVREAAPGLRLLFGNLGAVQLNYGVGAADIRRLIEAVGCDAFNFHLNPLQEIIQPEGNRDFSGLVSKLRGVIPELGVPVFFKEVGAGISRKTARKLKDLPFHGIETSGVGGTSWAKIESLRATRPAQKALGESLARWGVPTAESLVHCREELPDRILIASGGVRGGLEIAKAIALGADAAALALPFLRAAERSVDDVVQAIETIVTELRAVLFLTGCPDLKTLRAAAPAILRKGH